MPLYEKLRENRATARRRKFLSATLAVFLVFVFVAWAGIGSKPRSVSETAPRHPESDPAPETQPEAALSEKPENQLTEISGQIESSQAFSEALLEKGVSHDQVFGLVSAVRAGVHRSGFNPNLVQRGDRYRLGIDSLGTIQTFEFVKNGDSETRFVALRENGSLRARTERNPLDREAVVVSGVIKDVLWNALAATGEDPAVLSDKMVDIFEYYIDFMVDCRADDRFSLIVEKFSKDGRFLRYGDILAAEYAAARNSYRAFRFEGPQIGSGYYGADGKSLQGLFLKSPLNYRRISSRYNPRRFHPILKKIIPHHGVDYAADYGSPVWTTADGTVTFVGRKGALGKYVEVRHKNGYKTGYGHLSRFRKGLKKGAYVRQKQTIGYVGATGRATGPHLHYNFFVRHKNGNYRLKDPGKVVVSLKSKSLPSARLPDFFQHRDRLLALLDGTPGSVVTAYLDDESREVNEPLDDSPFGGMERPF